MNYEETVHFSDKGLLYYNPNSDESQIKKQLMQLGNVRVFSRSSQVTQYYKEKNIKMVADYYFGKISERLYNGMYNYIVEIDD